jgi:hypothetical protein
MEDQILQHRADSEPAGPPVPPDYEPPRVLTYRGDEIVHELGPAQACSFVHSVILC